jgi:hypothetical protein
MPGAAVAAGGPAVLESTAEMDFPMNLSFSLAAASDTEITDIRLHYRVERMEHALITSEVSLDFVPASSVEETWVWDMRKTGGLPPGSSVVYWWTVADAGGSRIETEPAEILIEDNRYPWNTLTEGMVTLYWYRGDAGFAGEVMDAAQGALSRLAANTGAKLEKPVKLYLYASSQDLRGSMIFPQEWTGGVAFTRYGIIAIGIAPGSLDWGSRAIAHELTHLVVHQVTFNPYGGLPTWLDEGLAMLAEGELEPGFQNILEASVEENSLITVRSLASPFSAYAGDATLGYAQSYSVAAYLVDSYGQEKMFELLSTFRQGSGYDEALESVYGFDTDGLDALWREHIGAGNPSATPVMIDDEPDGIAPAAVWILVGLAILAVLAVVILVSARARRRG